MTRLSNTRIMAELAAGNLVIEPFNPEQLNNVSYDMTLGRWVGRFVRGARGEGKIRRLAEEDPFTRFKFEFHSSNKEELDAAQALWFSHERAEEVPFTLYDNDEIMWNQGETILAVSREIAGGRFGITADLGAPSTVGRHDMTACRCAGVGDVGYCVHPWTLEMANGSYDLPILPVGAVVAQVLFSEVGEILPGTSYEVRGNYGADTPWHPLNNMLPKKIKVRP